MRLGDVHIHCVCAPVMTVQEVGLLLLHFGLVLSDAQRV